MWINKNAYWERPLISLGPLWHTMGNHWRTQEEEELRVHVRKDHFWSIQQLFGTTCFSREPRPTEKGRQPPGITPGDVCQPYARPAAGTSAAGKEWLQCWSWDRETLSCQAALWLTAQLTPGQVKPQPRRTRGSGSPPFSTAGTILMSNISPFDKSRATGHRAEDVTAGNDKEWRVRKLINVRKGVKHLPLGVQFRAAVWINEAVFGSLWPAGQPAAVSSIWKCNEMSIAWLNVTPSVSSYPELDGKTMIW